MVRQCVVFFLFFFNITEILFSLDCRSSLKSCLCDGRCIYKKVMTSLCLHVLIRQYLSVPFLIEYYKVLYSVV